MFYKFKCLNYCLLFTWKISKSKAPNLLASKSTYIIDINGKNPSFRNATLKIKLIYILPIIIQYL